MWEMTLHKNFFASVKNLYECSSSTNEKTQNKMQINAVKEVMEPNLKDDMMMRELRRERKLTQM